MLAKIQILIKPFVISVFCALLAVILMPYAINGFWADDALNSQTWGMLNRFNSSLWDFSYRVCRMWVVDSGRLLVPWPAIYGFFYLMRSELAARIADMVLFIGHIGITLYLLRRIGISWRTVGLFVLVLMALLQIRDSNDPLAAYAGFSQVVGILLMVALLLLCKWHETNGAGWLLASSLVATLSMACYEVNITYIPIATIIVIASKRPKLLRNLAMTALPFAIFVAINFYVKHHATAPYSGSAIGNFGAAPVTFLKQLTATLPGTFYATFGQEYFPLPYLYRSAISSRLAWAVMLAWTVLAITMVQHNPTKQKGRRVAAFAALMLLLVPPFLISISIRYQSSLMWGLAHVPVYYQCFGLAFLIAAAVDRLASGLKSKLVVFLLLPFIGAYMALNWAMNMQQSLLYDAMAREPRDSFVTALHSGLLDDIRDGDVVQIENQPVFINGNLIYQTIQKNVFIPNEGAIAMWFESHPRADAKEYRLIRDPAPGNQWRLLAQ